MGLPGYTDYQVKDYLSFHEPGPLHTYDRIYAPSDHKYDHMWQYKYSNRPGSQILRVEEERKPRKPVKRLNTPKQARARTPATTRNMRSSPKGRASPTDRGREGRNTKPTALTTTAGSRRPPHKPLEMWQYKDYLSYHEPGPYHDYRSNHQPGHHPYDHMWTYHLGNRPGSQHVRVEPHKEPVKRRVIVKPRTATPKPRPRQQPVKKTEEKKTMRAEERKVATPPPPKKEPVRRAEPVPPPPTTVVTQKKQQAPPPVKKATPPPRHTTPPPPRHTTPPPPRRQVTPPRRQVTPPRRQVTPPRREVTPPRRRYSPPPTPIQHYRSEPEPVFRSTVAAAAAPRVEPTYQSRIPVRRSHQTSPPRLSPPSQRQPLLRHNYRLRPESKWNAPRLDLPRYEQQQRRLREEREKPRWKPIRTYNGTPRQGPLSTNYGDHTMLYDSKPSYFSRPTDYSQPSYARHSYPQNDRYYVRTPQYRYEPSYYTGYKDPLSSVKRTMILYGV